MTSTLTAKQQTILDHIRDVGEASSIYALAQQLGRPYNRVRAHVYALLADGLLEISQARHGGRVVKRVRAKAQTPGAGERRRQPPLSYSRFWSSPITGVSDDVLIAGVVAEPTLDDLVACCVHYGVARVRQVYSKMLAAGEMTPLIERAVGRMLGNIEIGFSRAA